MTTPTIDSTTDNATRTTSTTPFWTPQTTESGLGPERTSTLEQPTTPQILSTTQESSSPSTSTTTVSTSSTAAPPIDRCHSRLDIGTCPSSAFINTSSSPTPIIQWYYDVRKLECLAYTYYGCESDERASNRFRSRMDCSLTCESMDRTTCALGRPSKPGQRRTLPSTDRTCANLRCPPKYQCIQGPMHGGAAMCCENKTELAYDMANSGLGLCPANSSALYRDDEIVVGGNCKVLQCPDDYECRRNAYFSNCCQYGTQTNTTSSATALTIDEGEKTNATSSSYLRVKRDVSDDDDTLTDPAWMTSGKIEGDIAGFADEQEFDQYMERLNSQWSDRRAANEHELIADSATSDLWRKWPDGVVPYVINSGSDELREAITAAMQDFHTNTCVRFVERTNERSYLNIISTDEGCFSNVGRRNASAPQIFNLGNGCWTKAEATHELMHALGFWHEHQRTDRDEHVIVHQQTIEPRCFKKMYKKAAVHQMHLIGTYDIHSIMHYPSTTLCSTTGEPTMTPKNSSITTMGNKVGLTKEDIRKIRILYQCSMDGSTTSPSTVTATTTAPKPIVPTTVFRPVPPPIPIEVTPMPGCRGSVNTWSRSDKHLEQYEMCAFFNNHTNCNSSTWAGLEVNRAMDDLALYRNGRRSTGTWDDQLASVELRSHCSLTLCTDKYFRGDCRKYEGGEHGQSIDQVHSSLERRISSVYCVCPVSVTPSSNCHTRNQNATYNNGTRYHRLCGTVYDEINCNGNGLWLPTITYHDLTTIFTTLSNRNKRFWNDEIASLVINPGCQITLCTDKNLADNCETYYRSIAKDIHHLGAWLKSEASSLRCTCG